ncbi:hypothetical protein [Candidatus Cardinium hertigii]|uniref:hypothetical protein n=1 Tax=Candidatus Cardinium hertigii TaxID=247481 RepID=UPI001FA9B230|nr:hypothetical protein [Candidatus Cardinium hertigii]
MAWEKIEMGGENEFTKLEKAITEQYRDNVSIIKPEFRSNHNRDFTLTLKEQAQGVYNEVLPTLTQLLSEKQGKRKLNIQITGKSQGGVIAWILAKRLHEAGFNVEQINLINTPVMGLSFLNLSLKNIQGIQDSLRLAKELFPFPIEELLDVANKACENRLGDVQLIKLVDSQSDIEQYNHFEKLLGDAYTRLLKSLNEKYKGLTDIQSYVDEIWNDIRVGDVTCSSENEANNKPKTRIHLIHSAIDQSTLDEVMMGLASLIEHFVTKPVKVINGMDSNAPLELTDTIIPGNEGICKRRKSFSEGGLEQTWKNLKHTKSHRFSTEELRKNGYKPNVRVTITKGHIHEPINLEDIAKDRPTLNSILLMLNKIFPRINSMLSSSLLNSPSLYPLDLIFRKSIDDSLEKNPNTTKNTTPKLQEDNDLD